MNGTFPLVSVIIPNYNGKKFLKPCLHSLFASDYSNMEVIVVDNGSSDGSADFLRTDYPCVNIIQFDKNTGFACACNAGIKSAGGKYIFLLNNDVEVIQDCISVLVDILLKYPQYSMATGKILRYGDKTLIDAAGDGLTVGAEPYNRGHNQPDDGRFDSIEEVMGVCAGAALYRKSVFDQIGLFDEDFFAYMEDVDFNLRALISGFRSIYVPSAVCFHHGNATFGTLSPKHVFLTNRNKIYFVIKNFRLKWIVQHFAQIWEHQLEMAKLFSFTEKGRSFFKSRLSALVKVPKMILKRHLFLIRHKPDWDSAYRFLDKK